MNKDVGIFFVYYPIVPNDCLLMTKYKCLEIPLKSLLALDHIPPGPPHFDHKGERV